ncbi:Aste57867_3751 [Aphanomyces stellatus]|uniref:Aste57867_3751 protein n=1 Tax=Aphanomyces stellatus TaxID=120398 RepID=A0A485KBD7_9STRA|nr:hypothetical protein As57867_003740 [Aphanomyces stellatus]VFT80903.1 Aste57867_3751 [Aphanomyces stellatus]
MPSCPYPASRGHAAPSKGGRNLSDEQRRAVYEMLLELAVDGVLPRGAFTNTAHRIGCNWQTISRLWSQARSSLAQGAAVADVAAKMKGKPLHIHILCIFTIIESHRYLYLGNCGRRPTRTQADIKAAIKAVPQHDRQTLRALAESCKIPKTTIKRHMDKEESTLKARSSRLKPLLTEANAKDRLKYALSFLRPALCGNHVFVNMYDQVHVDEKWFFITKVNRKFYVYDDEEVALRAAKSKKFITKVMFLAAVARPRHDTHRNCAFDGKIGMWPFVEQSIAKRTSKNRPKGSIETKPLSVDGVVYKSMIINKVVPAIQAKFPVGNQPNGVFIQQDNAGPHTCVTTKFLRAHGVSGISMTCQPANSPDFNVLDLGFFNAIQNLQQKKPSRSIDQLIDAVTLAFDEMPIESLAKTFITLQSVMERAMEVNGGNNYKLPHLHKDKCIDDLASFNVACAPSTHQAALLHLNSLA